MERVALLLTARLRATAGTARPVVGEVPTTIAAKPTGNAAISSASPHIFPGRRDGATGGAIPPTCRRVSPCRAQLPPRNPQQAGDCPAHHSNVGVVQLAMLSRRPQPAAPLFGRRPNAASATRNATRCQPRLHRFLKYDTPPHTVEPARRITRGRLLAAAAPTGMGFSDRNRVAIGFTQPGKCGSLTKRCNDKGRNIGPSSISTPLFHGRFDCFATSREGGRAISQSDAAAGSTARYEAWRFPPLGARSPTV